MLAVLLLDENTSPRIVRALWKHDVDAIHVRDRNLLAAPDHEVWKFALGEARTIVTINARDFRNLAERTQAHPGIIVIPSGGSPDSQLKLILAAVNWVTSANSPGGFSNRYLEVNEQSEIVLTELLCAGDNGL